MPRYIHPFKKDTTIDEVKVIPCLFDYDNSLSNVTSKVIEQKIETIESILSALFTHSKNQRAIALQLGLVEDER